MYKQCMVGFMPLFNMCQLLPSLVPSVLWGHAPPSLVLFVRVKHRLLQSTVSRPPIGGSTAPRERKVCVWHRYGFKVGSHILWMTACSRDTTRICSKHFVNNIQSNFPAFPALMGIYPALPLNVALRNNSCKGENSMSDQLLLTLVARWGVFTSAVSRCCLVSWAWSSVFCSYSDTLICVYITRSPNWGTLFCGPHTCLHASAVLSSVDLSEVRLRRQCTLIWLVYSQSNAWANGNVVWREAFSTNHKLRTGFCHVSVCICMCVSYTCRI